MNNNRTVTTYVASCCKCTGICGHSDQVPHCFCTAHGGGPNKNIADQILPALSQSPSKPEYTFTATLQMQGIALLTELLKEVKEINEKLRRIENDMDTIRPYQ